ncbi:uncharacterized protein LOC111713674 isoform X2 [Eurytemora carolleeae]|uniref:uncharacterized protein LOC111713674 isoform X2 n=1 Tax=Eurytemora carolleeae TaxID=1294199 RepID=UPI000C77E1B5|nr:uncharacterized protein LOC111713674 isoform X2 [Eurytemora carolleeae]|eukprot:XP_023344368.1 uncharacterized protein LOC111713674 isoform X2 [Eurytemora affinis]
MNNYTVISLCVAANILLLGESKNYILETAGEQKGISEEPESQINEPKTYLVETKEKEKGRTPGGSDYESGIKQIPSQDIIPCQIDDDCPAYLGCREQICTF